MARMANWLDPRKQTVPRSKNQGAEHYTGRWYHLGTREACAMLESLGYSVVEPDVCVTHRDPVIHFMKP